MSIERQRSVSIAELLRKLVEEVGVKIEEIELGSGMPRLYMLWCKLPQFPFGDREHVWYPLLVKQGQTEIDREKVDAILRHLWHSSAPFFEDEIELELEPEDAHEREIAEKVDAKAREVKQAGGQWSGSSMREIRESLSFSPSDAEYEYLEARLEWRQTTPIAD